MARASTIGPICIDHESPEDGMCRTWYEADHHKDNPEWWVTEDGYKFEVGDRLFDYYDCQWVIVMSEPKATNLGWFDVHKEGAENPKSTYTTNSVRVSKNTPVWYKGANKERNT